MCALVLLVACTLLTAPRAGAQELIYAPAAAADAIHAAGIHDAWRQAPVDDAADPRWPAERRLGKVQGDALARLDAAGMVALLRANMRRDTVGAPAGGIVAVDEIVPNQWSTAASRQLTRAMALLGTDARRVVFYLNPAFVERVGRADPRAPLPTAPDDLAALVAAVQHGIVYLELYRGTFEPFPRDVMAAVMVRWEARWPPARRPDLRLMFGPGGTVGQDAIWDRVRSTPSGRRLLANGPGYYADPSRGTAADGAAWARRLAAHRAAPDAPPPGGDVKVASGGGLRVVVPAAGVRPGGTLTVRADRAGRTAVRLILAGGRQRYLRTTPRRGAPGVFTVRLPRDLRAGVYRLGVTFRGEGLRDSTVATVRVRRCARPVGARVCPIPPR